MILTATMVCSPLPAAAYAAETGTANFSETNVTWIGTQAEYTQTLDNMFVDGMRKMKAGDKWGIVDATGEWVAPPIYDKIELNYLVERDGISNDAKVRSSEPLEVLFLDGYTQCVRNGKMGLLNQYGEEAIPAQYDAVGLPSEGISRIIKMSGGTAYLGYWSLELGRELVEPNKYVVGGTNATAAGKQMVYQMLDKSAVLGGLGGSSDPDTGSMMIDYREMKLPNGSRLAAEHDYMDGYTFVTTGKGAGDCQYGTILDKNGKEILPGGPYMYRGGLYPQFGPYMVYVRQSDNAYPSDQGDLGRPYLSGVVGPEGVVIPAQYTGGVRSPIEGWYVGDARMTVIPELSLVITAKDTAPGKENGGKVGVINFKNQTVIPFIYDFNFFTYNAEHKIFAGDGGGGIQLYTAAGKRLNNTGYYEIGESNNYDMTNGFAQVKIHAETTKGFVNLKTGAEIFPAMLDEEYGTNTEFSAQGLVWVRNPDKKWGLIDGTGKVILPYQYDAVSAGDTWTRAKNGFAIVNIGHKQGIVTSGGVPLVPCDYEKLSAPAFRGPADAEYVEATKDGKAGLVSILTGQLVIPASYQGIGGMDAAQFQSDYFTLGATPVRTGEKDYCLVDRNGNKIPGSDYQHLYTAKRGLFNTAKNGLIGAEGKVIFPDTLAYSGRKNFVIDDTTLVVRGGRVGYINADRLAKPTKPKAAAPRSATAVPSAMNLMVDGRSAAVEAYGIGGDDYIKVQDMACLVNGTGKSFGVTYHAAKNAVELKSGAPYIAAAGDMAGGDGMAKPATRSADAIYIDGIRRSFTAYSIGGSSFFKLRDVMRAFDIYMGYENGIVTVDTTRGYKLTDGEKADIIPAAAEAAPPPAAQVNKLEITKSPNLEFYMTGDHTFRTEGFELRYWDEDGVPHTVTDTDEMVFTVEGKVIEDGYVFTVSSMKTGTVGYEGLTAPLRFPVYQGTSAAKPDPVPGQSDKQLSDGKYIISVLGNTVGMSNGWLVLDSQRPVTFNVKKEGGYYYLYLEEVTRNSYIGVSIVNGQLISNSKQKWSITHLGGDTYGVRQYEKPEMVVNACGEASKDGTQVIVWKNTATPKNAVLTFTAVN